MPEKMRILGSQWYLMHYDILPVEGDKHREKRSFEFDLVRLVRELLHNCIASRIQLNITN